jgi:hypothetical protein
LELRPLDLREYNQRYVTDLLDSDRDYMALNITIPSHLSEEAVSLAHQLGIPLDELITAAITSYLETHLRDKVTEKLNQVYNSEVSSIDPVLMTMQTASFAGDDEW